MKKRGYNPFNGPDKTPLTKREKDIVGKLQRGWMFVTGNEFGAYLCPPKSETGAVDERIRLDVFFSLEAKEMIFQDGLRQHNYYLTPLGKETKV